MNKNAVVYYVASIVHPLKIFFSLKELEENEEIYQYVDGFDKNGNHVVSFEYNDETCKYDKIDD